MYGISLEIVIFSLATCGDLILHMTCTCVLIFTKGDQMKDHDDCSSLCKHLSSICIAGRRFVASFHTWRTAFVCVCWVS